MSRIAGYCTSNPDAAAVAERMLAVLPLQTSWKTHRVNAGNCGLGWSGWRRPNSSQAAGRIAVMDGVIYNRKELGARPDETDAALLSRLVEQHSPNAALNKVNGDFAAIIYDSARGEMLIAVDRFRVKPLYYVARKDFLAAASQPRPLLAVPGVSRAPNRQFVGLFAGSHYRTIDNAVEQSPFDAISSLPAGHFGVWKNGAFSTTCYWRLQERPDLTASEAELAEQYRALILDAVALRLPVAEKKAFTLSGGMDSSSVLASAVHLTGEKQDAVSSVYVDKTYDESAEIKTMLGPTVKKWHTIEVDIPDIFTLVREMVAIHNEPVATATWLSHYVLCREISGRGFGSLFGGLGSDELNAGEYEHYWYYFADLRTEKAEARLKEEVDGWVQYHNHPIFQKSYAIMEETLPKVVDLARPGRCLPDRGRIDRYAATVNRDYFDVLAFQPVMETPFRSYLKNRTYQDLTRETIPCCLRAEDRQTAAFGLDNFLPFMDYRLAELMFSVPGTLKFDHGATKRLLREAMKGILPEETRTRVKKTGWNAPAHIWFSGAGRQTVLDLIEAPEFARRGIYNVAEVRRLLDEHDQIVTRGLRLDNHMMFFWQLVNMELWMRACVDGAT